MARMSRLGLLAAAACLAAPAVAGAASGATDGAANNGAADRDVLAYRRQLMITLNEQSAALGMVLSGAVSGDAVAHLEAIALAASYATKAFTPRVEGGEARAEIWSRWADFSRRMDDFARKTAAAAKAARATGPAQVDVLGALACKACHDIYRDETAR